MKRPPLAAAVLALGLAACAEAPTVAEVGTRFAATFHNMPVEQVQAAELPGLYEVYSGGKLFYYAPAQQLLLFGEFYRTDGTNLSAAKAQDYLARRTLSLPADAGIRVGEGRAELTAFLDPDCGHCHEAWRWLESRDYAGVTLRVLFLPIDPGAPSYGRALQFVCAPPALRREALRQVYAHENPAPGQRLLSCPGGAAELARQAEIARGLGIEATPTFLLQGQTVLGFNRERLESLLTPTIGENP